MRPSHAIHLLFASALAIGAVSAAHAEPVPMDHARDVNGIKVACAGVGQESQADPRWNAYAVKLDFVGGYGQYLGNERVAVRDRGGRVLDVHCHAPWVLMDLRPGRYDATTSIPNGPAKQIRFTVPETGQRRVIIRYRDKTRGNPAMMTASYPGPRQRAQSDWNGS